jgi:anti-sigma regulatory factor (Ser/Thr protein kinase)
MATVEVTFTPLSAHVRTARLVATAVARRSGVPDALLDEVRLAVGEACSRAVEAHQAACPAEPVRVAMTDQAGRFEVEVVNNGRSLAQAQAEGTSSRAGRAESPPDPLRLAGVGAGALVPAGFSLAVIAGLADDVQISETPAGTSIRMSWPLSGSFPAGASA